MSATENSLALKQSTADLNLIYESLALRGDMSGLTPQLKVTYYRQLCERLGLDPTTQPFLPLKLNGKEILYASRGATDQLARIHHVNREVISRERIEDVYVVTVRATLPSGRTEDSIGAVALGQLKGDALANCLMKAETKSKRRATLAILGLGLLDETELETIPERAKQEIKFESQPTAPLKALASPAQISDQLSNQIRELCAEMNTLGAEPKWTGNRLNAHVTEAFRASNGLQSIDEAQGKELLQFLEAEKLSLQITTGASALGWEEDDLTRFLDGEYRVGKVADLSVQQRQTVLEQLHRFATEGGEDDGEGDVK